MHWAIVLLALSASGALANRRPLFRRDDINSTETENPIDPKRFIVEFAEGIDINSAVAELDAKKGTKILKVFDTDIFRGASVEAQAENPDSLQALKPVFQAWPARRIKLSPSIPLASFSENAAAQNYSVHHMTGVDKLHAAGIRGKGVIVAVVDTGVDYNHPALGGGFGSGFKVAGGYDFIGDGNWPTTAKAPDADPMDYEGHGTHVSGIIAANDDKLVGVAPDVTLLVYKVFNDALETDDEALIDSFLKAYDDGADIITSSVGSVNGWTDNAWAVVASRLVERGVVVTISAGNTGEVGPYAAGHGSSGDYVLAIASVEADILSAASFIATFNVGQASNTTIIAYESVAEESWSKSLVKGWPIIPLTLNTAVLNDACNPLPSNTSDLSNIVVLVRRGGCDYEVKQANIMAFNATHLLVYNDENIMEVPNPGGDPAYPILAMITSEAGAAIIDTIKAGGNVTADFSMDPIANHVGIENEINGGKASDYTSLGPTNDLYIKPDVAAPGGQIFSTWLGSGWSIQSGTSMACPYVAGVAALYISKYGGRKDNGPGFAKDLAMRIISSGDAIPWDNGNSDGVDYGMWASVAQVGTGLINAVKVLDYDTTLSFAKFALNDTHHFSRYHSVDITNGGNSPVTYTFEVQESGGMETYITDTEVFGAPRIATFVEVSFSPKRMSPAISLPEGTFTVKPGQTRTAQFNFMWPQGLDAKKLPVYSGKVLIKGSNGQSLSVPYLGLAANLHEDLDMMFEYPLGLPRIVSTRRKIPFSEKSSFTFDLAKLVNDFPNLYLRLNYATRELRWDIFDDKWVERDWKYPPVVGKAGYIGSATSWSQAEVRNYFDPAKDDEDDLILLPITNLPRDITGVYGVELWWLGRLANGTQISPGRYKMRVAALEPFGSPDHSDNWDIFKTPAFEVFPLIPSNITSSRIRRLG